tara:strand:- start:843 stop:1415 length:573 start_codon:yes stop_codon:yes gene_type:complete
MKVSIGIVIAIVAQAFGIIWYVAQLDSTVTNLDHAVADMQMAMTDTSIAVLETNVQNIESSLWEINDKVRQITDNPQAPEHFHDQQQHFHPEYDIISSDSHFHSEFNNIQQPISLDGIHIEIQLLKESVNERKQEIKDMDWRLDEAERVIAIAENEMRTIMSDHMGINDALKNLGAEGYGDTREYGNYGE